MRTDKSIEGERQEMQWFSSKKEDRKQALSSYLESEREWEKYKTEGRKSMVWRDDIGMRLFDLYNHLN